MNMFQKLYQFFASNIRNKLLLWMLLISLPALVGVALYSASTARGLIYEYTLREQENHVNELGSNVLSFLSDVREDVLFLSELEGITELLSAADAARYEAARQRLEREFAALSQVKGIYYQVRFIDATGMEIVRVDYGGRPGDKPFVVPRDQLQDKSGRYYFDDTITLPEGEIMVSPLDLNIERGEIERPFKPVIRYATPVWFEDRSAGIVIVNVLAERFLEKLGEQAEGDAPHRSETIALIDQDGYYLYHSTDENKRWGRDLETGITLGQDYPQAMAHTAARIFASPAGTEGQGSTVEGADFLTYSSITPPGTTTHRWAVVSIRPESAVLAPLLGYQRVVAGILLASIVAIGILGYWGSSNLVSPIKRLERLATNMGRGDLETPISPEVSVVAGDSARTLVASTPDEIGVLAQTMDRARIALRQAYQDLEEQVAKAERRAVQLQTAAQVSSAAVAILDPQALLDRVVRLISERFNFYHTGIFLLDEAGQWAVLQAVSSPGGQRMLARGHRLRVSHPSEGIVGYVAASGKPRIALDIGEDAVHFANPDLPQTRSEMALPLQARAQMVGVLDVQSTQEAAFSEEDVVVLQTLADQVAMTIANTRLFRESQEHLEVLQRVQGDYSFRAWMELARSRAGIGYRYYQKNVSLAKDFWRSEMALALQKEEAVQDAASPERVVIPLRIRDQVIGVMDACKLEGSGEWTEEELALLETLSDQVGVALESARLYQDTQRRVAREQLISEITTHMRESMDMDTILQTTVQEMREVLDLAEAEIRLGK